MSPDSSQVGVALFPFIFFYRFSFPGFPFIVVMILLFFQNTLEKCSVCMKPILDRILRATGKPYHPQCFSCIVCGKSLDGIPFTVDATNQIHCIEDFHRLAYQYFVTNTNNTR